MKKDNRIEKNLCNPKERKKIILHKKNANKKLLIQIKKNIINDRKNNRKKYYLLSNFQTNAFLYSYIYIPNKNITIGHIIKHKTKTRIYLISYKLNT